MSDDNNQNRPRIIDVTKPKETTHYTPSIDTSRVSAHTAREQQALDRLRKKVGNLDQRENRASAIKTVIAIILVLLLIVLAVLFIMFLGKANDAPEIDYEIRLSMQIENKSSLLFVNEYGQEKLREINPGDQIPLRAVVRNSNKYSGDITKENEKPPAIFVRFKLVLVLEYEERFDIMIPTLTKDWYAYDAEAEAELKNGVKENDNYYYFIGQLNYMEEQELFSEILFDGNVITCEDGGKYGQIQVHVDSIEASISQVQSRSLWPTAPQAWIQKLTKAIAD